MKIEEVSRVELELMVKRGENWRECERSQTPLLLDQGMFTQEVARQLGMNVRMVGTTRIRWLASGRESLGHLPRSGAPSMASMAKMERELTAERPRAGLEVAHHLGRKSGRKRKMTDSKIESAKNLLANGVPPRDAATNLGVSLPTLYRSVPTSPHA